MCFENAVVNEIPSTYSGKFPPWHVGLMWTLKALWMKLKKEKVSKLVAVSTDCLDGQALRMTSRVISVYKYWKMRGVMSKHFILDKDLRVRIYCLIQGTTQWIFIWQYWLILCALCPDRKTLVNTSLCDNVRQQNPTGIALVFMGQSNLLAKVYMSPLNTHKEYFFNITQ